MASAEVVVNKRKGNPDVDDMVVVVVEEEEAVVVLVVVVVDKAVALVKNTYMC